MKKFAKLLFVVMALALVVSAFGVSASAEDTVVTNSQLYIGEYTSSTHSGMAHIVFGTVSNADVEYGVIIEDEAGLRFKFEGKAIGATGKYGIAIYDLPEGTYKAQAYTGADDARTLGEQTIFTMGKATYTVTLDYNGATGFDSNEIVVAQGSALDEIDMTNVTLGGANFVEWVGANGLAYDFSTILTSDITLSAIFESKYGTDMMYTYTTTGATYFGINECVNVGLGGSVVWQFDCLAYENTSSQIRLVAGSATAASGNAMQYKPAWGEAASVMGFTANNAKDWYGGDYGKTGGKETMFKADYTYRLEYIAPTGQYVADGSFKLYECETAKVGTDAESWNNTFLLTGVNNVEGGNSFAPITSVNLNIYVGKGVKFATANNTLTVNGEDAQDVTMGITGTPDWDYLPNIIYGTAKKYTITGDGLIGNLDGFDIGYGGSIAWQFDVQSVTMSSTVWYFGVTDYPIANIQSAPSMISCYKWGYKGERLGFYTARDMDWFGGTSHGTTRQSNSTFASGFSYKFVYTAPTADNSADGSAILYECATEYIGTAMESWTEILYVKGVDNSANTFAPTADVKIGLYLKGSLEMVMDNVSIVAKTASDTIANTNVNVTCGNTTVEKVEYVAPEVEEFTGATVSATWTNNGSFGFGENGINLSYGDTLSWTFDVTSYTAAGWVGFCISNTDVKASYNAVLDYKSAGVATNRFVFTTKAYDWLNGTQTFKRNATNCLRAGYSYKFVYNTPSSADVNDGSMYLYECEPGTLGTPSEAWNLCASLVGFGNNNANGYSFAPMENVKIVIYAQSGLMGLGIENSIFHLPNDVKLNGPYFGVNVDVVTE